MSDDANGTPRRAILSHQVAWAEDRGIVREPWSYAATLTDNLFRPLHSRTKDEFNRADGGELVDGQRPAKMRALHSSSALVCNVMDYWRSRDPEPLRQALGLDAPITSMAFEQRVPSGLRGRSPNVDVLFHLADDSYVAVESKFCEIYSRGAKGKPLSPSYFPRGRQLWTEVAAPGCQELAVHLHSELVQFEHLDAAQLLKQILGLRNTYGAPVMLYLWYDSGTGEARSHAAEVGLFRDYVGAEVDFRSMTYQELFARLEAPGEEGVEYLDYLRTRYLAPVREPLPHPDSYAVPGGGVVAGNYPFRKDPAEGRRKLAAHVDAGITFFLDLTTPEDPLSRYLPHLTTQFPHIEYRNLGIPDNGVPTPERMAEILDVVEAAVADGHRVYVHCWGGVGRTGTVVGCLLVRRGYSGEDALAEVQRLFLTMSPETVRRHSATGSPQMEVQRDFIREWKDRRPLQRVTRTRIVHEAPTPRSVRLEDARVWVGEDPARHDRPQLESKLEALLGAGVTCFLSLAGPPAYTEVAQRVANRRGIEVTFTTADLPAVPGPGAESAMRRALDELDRAHREGHGVYVHAGGIGGRLSAFLACHAVRAGESAKEALTKVQSIGEQIADASGHPVSPLVEAWEAFVRGWGEGEDERLLAGGWSVPRYRRDQARGALIGLAVGDALGAAVEFEAPGSFDPVTDMRGGGPWGLEPGFWTDDTSMALCLAESFVHRRKVDVRDQMERYVRWLDEGHLSSTGEYFDCGKTIRGALDRFKRTGDALSGSTDPMTAGNGSLMRLAPAPLFALNRDLDPIEVAAATSRTTHGTQVAVDACRYLAALLLGALRGATKEELLGGTFEPWPGCWTEEPLHPAIARIAAGSFRAKEPPEIKGSGYAADSFEAALWAFHRGRDFREGCLLAVNLGRDADTTGAVYGQLAGAFYGESAIPVEWRSALARKELLDRYAEWVSQLTFRGHDLTSERMRQAVAMEEEVLREHGSARGALLYIAGAKAAYVEEVGTFAAHMGGSMGALAAEAEAELRLAVQLGVDLAMRSAPPLVTT
jgi:ADP-ribosyl-[dinitrogen reductase] hydrolase